MTQMADGVPAQGPVEDSAPGQPEPDARPVRRQINQKRLDFLRGIAATYVVINHARGTFYAGGAKIFADPTSTPLDKLWAVLLQTTSLGAEFVVLFFVLSGFAMAHSIRYTSDTRRFYLKRVVRIWPPYIAATLFALLAGMLIGSEEIQRRWLEVLFYISPGTDLTSQFWSLPYEVVFYALCPFILASESRIRWLGMAAAAFTCAMLLGNGPMLNPSGYFFLNFLGNELLFFAAGAFAYYQLDRVPGLTLGRFLLVVALGLALVWLIRLYFGGPNMVSSMVMVGIAVLAIRNAPDVPNWANFGFFSYSIYIFHLAVISLIAAFLLQNGITPSEIHNPLAWILVLPIVLGVCFIFYGFTERLSNKVVDRIRRRH